MNAHRTVRCPTCGASVEWTPQSKWRPFCSERCRTIDLGAWANESYRVPAVGKDDEDEAGAPGPDAEK
jgi:endogenous inhibitor of DNA gyrase (YacG/DUF329 family)